MSEHILSLYQEEMSSDTLSAVRLTPEVVEKYATAFGLLARDSGGNTIVLGRDARASGPMFAEVVTSALQSVGVTVIDCGLIPTPTAQLAGRDG